MSVPQDAPKNHPAPNNKEQKVIVLSMKNMPSFKFDVTKSLLTSNQDNGQSVFSFKPQQLLQSPTTSTSHTLQVVQKSSATNIQVVPQSTVVASPVHQKIQGTPGTILIRAQSPTTSIQKTQHSMTKPQQIIIQSHPTIKLQDNSASTGLRKMSTEITMKNQAGHTVVLHSTPSSAVKTQAVLGQMQAPQHKKIIVPAQSSSNQTKIFQIASNQKSTIPKHQLKIIQPTVKESSKPIPILPKPDAAPQKIVVQQHVILPSTMIVQQSTAANQPMKSNVITIPVTTSSFVKYNVSQPQQQATKWAMPTVSNIFPPALAPIQPKVPVSHQKLQVIAAEKNDNLKMLMEIDEIDSESENFNDDDVEEGNYESDNENNEVESEQQSPDEKTPEKTFINMKRSSMDEEQQFLDVKRIIEGDDEILAEKSTDSESKLDDEDIHNDNSEIISTEIKESCEQSKTITFTTTSITNIQQNSKNNNNNSNSLLLCDEQISSVTPEESPENSDKPKDQVTPMHTNEEVPIKSQSIEDVKKNLKLDIISSSSTAHDKNNDEKMIIEQEESESIINDDDHSSQSSMIEQKRSNDDNENDSPLKSEILLEQASTSKSVAVNVSKPKRNRKPKNPTVITTLGLPYKPPQPSNRKKKVEKKVELEMDFHDPLNKIMWEDGIGGLNNCNKLFGFNEFGLIEVLSTKDATAKLKNDEKLPDDNFNFKFRKIVDPKDKFVCVICSKLGTVRDFYSPECCSESCFAITKRKTTEFNNSSSRDDNQDSGLISPIDAKKVIFEGELITLQQLQQHLLDQELPESKRKHGSPNKASPSAIPEVKFSWDTYLTSKSVPAPEHFFLHTSKTASTHFRVGMKLEAIDPKNQHMICVCSVEEKLGCRMKIHFDGYPSTYDFWTNSDSFDIFHIGFCHSTGRKLNVPPRWTNKKFDWTEYFDHTNSVGAQRYMFPRLTQSSESNPLTAGMKVEVKHGDFWYAATVIDVLNLRVLIRFDGIYEELGCKWFDIYSPYLNPCNGHKTLDDPRLFKPPFKSNIAFDWAEYIRTCGAKESPTDFLLNKTRKAYQFEPGMKLEVVDKVNPQLIRPATILCRNDYKIQVIFDGFDINYAYWLDDDSEDIHPINYCKLTEHPIEHPAGANKFLENSLCSMNGCRGIGNGLYADRYFHDTPKECPYHIDNWNRLVEQKENSRMDYKPYVRKSKNATGGNENAVRNRSLLLQPKATNKYKKEKQDVEIKEEQIVETETSSDTVKVTKRRARKRKIVQPVEAEEKKEIIDEDNGERAVKIRVIKHFLEEYGPQMNYAYSLWTKNSKVLDKAMITDEDLSENPIKWNVDDVCTFLVKFCDEETTAKFYAQKIDGEALLSLCQQDLVTLMNIKVGPAIKIYNRILWLRQEVMTKFTEF